MSIKKGSITIASSVPITEWGSIEGTLSDQTDIQNALNSKAPTLSPSFTGIPTVPTASQGTNTNQIASTKFVKTEINEVLENIDALPDQTGQSGKYLTTNGTAASWASFDDSNLVHRTGDETIAGIKTFQNNISAPNQVDYSQITNCITEIPQDIKLELNDGVLTLKAGSKVYVPNGSGVFTDVTLASDISRSTFGTQTGTNCIIECIYSGGDITAISWSMPTNTVSGTTTPSSGIFYNTDTNYINAYSDGSVVDQRSFPISLVTMSSGVVQSIDQVFNGFGYIGSTVFALTGVKGLSPNYKNTDGTLKNSNVSITSVVTHTQTSGTQTINISIGNTYINPTGATYDSDRNINVFANGLDTLNRCLCGTATYINGKVTSFQPKTAFHAVDYNEVKSVVFPSQMGNDGKALLTDGENVYWGDTSGVIIRDWSV